MLACAQFVWDRKPREAPKYELNTDDVLCFAVSYNDMFWR
jgi:hypothetical protein